MFAHARAHTHTYTQGICDTLLSIHPLMTYCLHPCFSYGDYCYYEHLCANVFRELVLNYLEYTVYLEVKSLDHMIALFLNFRGTPVLFSQLIHFTSLPTIHKGHNLSAFSPTLAISFYCCCYF